MANKILILGPGANTEGGITSVIQAYTKCSFWKVRNCIWIETYSNRNSYLKIWFFIKSIVIFLFYIPTSTIVHIHFSWQTSTIRKFPFLLITKIFKKKIIIHLHSGAEPVLNSKVKWIYRYFFQTADTTILLAHSIKENLSTEFHFKKTKIIYNPGPVCPVIDGSIRSNIILYAGHINENKGIFDLVKAFSSISTINNSWKLQIAGSGDIIKLNALINLLGLQSKVEFLGWVKNGKKDEIFKSASIFCLPSYTEGFPMVVIEAWAYGIPVITTPVGGLSDVIKHRQNAMIFEPGNTDLLAKHINELINNKELRQNITVEPLNLCKSKFSINEIAKEIDDLYSEILFENAK